MFLRRFRQPSAEEIKNIYGHVANLVRFVREHPDELARQFRWAVPTRQDFRQVLETPSEILTDAVRLVRFAHLQLRRFAGKPSDGGVNVRLHYSGRLEPSQMRRLIEAAHRRLEGSRSRR